MARQHKLSSAEGLTEEVVTAEVAKEETPQEDIVKVSMYIGPSIFQLIQHGTIYPGLAEDAVAQNAALGIALAKYPEIAPLVVDAADITRALNDIKTPGSDMYQALDALALALSGKNK